MFLEEISKRIYGLEKKLRQKQVLYSSTALVGEVSCCYVLGVDNSTGDIYYKDANGYWAKASSGGSGGGGSNCETNIDNSTTHTGCPADDDYVSLLIDDGATPIPWRGTWAEFKACVNDGVGGGDTFALFTQDTNTINFLGDGSELDPLEAHTAISSENNNGLIALEDGLYTPSAIRNGIIYGGIVTWVANYTYEVTAAGYYIDGIFYTSPAYTVALGNAITLDAPDGTNNRIDVFYVDNSSTVQVVNGTPSSTPTKPVLTTAQLELSFALVETGTTQPTITQQKIYDENVGETTEWTATTNAPLRISLGSTISPLVLTKSVEATNSEGNDTITFTNDAPLMAAALHTVLTFKIKPKSFTGNVAKRKRLEISFRLSGTVVGTTLNLNDGSFGYDVSSNTTQTISIALSQFGLVAANNVDNLYILNTSVGNATYGFQIDDVKLQGVPLPPPPVIGSGVQSVTGTTVNNTDPKNPIVGVPNLEQVTFVGNVAARDIYLQDVRVGRGGGAVVTNTALGQNALASNTTGLRNTAIGDDAMMTSTISPDNTAVGAGALALNTGLGFNTAIGSTVLGKQTTGYSNCAIGVSSMLEMLTGTNNTALGVASLRDQTSGQNNVAVGAFAMAKIQTGIYNTAIGASALANLVGAANRNVAIGTFALQQNTSGNYNTCVGEDTMIFNISGSFNTTLGNRAGYNTTGSSNVFLGYRAGYSKAGDHKLYISNEETRNLIHGDFLDPSVTINGETTELTSVLTVNSSTKGMLVPRITTAARTGIVSPAEGLLCFDTDLNSHYQWTGTEWQDLYNAGGGGGGNVVDTLDATTGAGDTSSRDIYIQGVRVGRGASAITSNTVVGESALSAVTTATDVTAVGDGALASLTTSGGNTAVGKDALKLITSSSGANVAMGDYALASLTSGTGFNTAVGSYSQWKSTGGYYNTSLGTSSLIYNTTGFWNTAIGATAMVNNLTGSHNTAVGLASMQANLSGIYNASVGTHCLYGLTSGGYNSGHGSKVMYTSTTATNNTAIGHGVMYGCNGNNNTGVGFQTLYYGIGGGSTASDQVAIGYTTLYDLASGVGNTAVGFNTGRGITTGQYNTIIGSNVTGLSTTLSNNVIISDGQGNKRLMVDSAGKWSAGTYGVGTHTGTGAYALQVDSSGFIIEAAISGGGGGSEATTASNGLTLTGVDVKLGGTLTGDTLIDGGSLYKLNITSDQISDYVLGVTNSNAGDGIYVNAGGTYGVNAFGSNWGVYGTGNTCGVQGNSSSIAVWGVASGSGIGVYGNSENNYALQGSRVPSSSNTVIGVINVVRETTGTPGVGIGGSIDFSLEDSTSGIISNKLISKLTNVTHASVTSEFSITGLNTAVEGTLLTLAGTGAAKLHSGYGTNTFTGTAAYALSVDSSGNVITSALGGGGGGASLTDITYSALATAIAGSTLTPGGMYRLTDFQTVHTIPYTAFFPSSATNTGAAEHLILTAISANELAPIAYSQEFPDDVVYYHPDNNTSVVPGCTKGYISRRIDTRRNNDICFDFRAVKFRRAGSTESTVWSSGTTYTKGDVVVDGSGNMYTAMQSVNLNHDPSLWDGWWYDHGYTNTTHMNTANNADADVANIGDYTIFNSTDYSAGRIEHNTITFNRNATSSSQDILSASDNVFLQFCKVSGLKIISNECYKNTFRGTSTGANACTVDNVTIMNGGYMQNNKLSTGAYLSGATVSNYSSFSSNKLKSGQFFNVNISNGSFFSSNNMFLADVDYITLDSNAAITGTYLQNSMYNTTFTGDCGFSSCTLMNAIINCTFKSNAGFSNVVMYATSNDIYTTTFQGAPGMNIAPIQLTGTTANYHKTVYKRPDGTIKYTYMDNSDAVFVGTI